jgi:hypothetical protein
LQGFRKFAGPGVQLPQDRIFVGWILPFIDEDARLQCQAIIGVAFFEQEFEQSMPTPKSPAAGGRTFFLRLKNGRTCRQAIMYYGWKMLQCLLISFVILLALSAAMAFDQEDYLYHIPEASGLIVDYEPVADPAHREFETPDFIYGENQGARVVEFYAP